MPLPTWLSSWATVGLAPVAISRVRPSGPNEMPP